MKKLERDRIAYGQFFILVTDGKSFWNADKFFYTFNLKSEEQKKEALSRSLHDAAIQQIKDKKNWYQVIEL